MKCLFDNIKIAFNFSSADINIKDIISERFDTETELRSKLRDTEEKVAAATTLSNEYQRVRNEQEVAIADLKTEVAYWKDLYTKEKEKPELTIKHFKPDTDKVRVEYSTGVGLYSYDDLRRLVDFYLAIKEILNLNAYTNEAILSEVQRLKEQLDAYKRGTNIVKFCEAVENVKKEYRKLFDKTDE